MRDTDELLMKEDCPTTVTVACMDVPGLTGVMAAVVNEDGYATLGGPVFKTLDDEPTMVSKVFDDIQSMKPSACMLWNVQWDKILAKLWKGEVPQRIPVRSVFGEEGYVEVARTLDEKGYLVPTSYVVAENLTKVLDADPIIRVSRAGSAERLTRPGPFVSVLPANAPEASLLAAARKAGVP